MADFITKDSGLREAFDTGAKRDTRGGKGRFDLLPVCVLRRYAELLERGAIKYGPNNWTKGMPLSRYMDSAIRHLCQLLEGATDEDHAAAVIFNVGAVIHHREMITRGELPAELDDLPRPVEVESS